MANEAIETIIEYAHSRGVAVNKQITKVIKDTTKIGKKILMSQLAKGDQVAAVGLFSSSSKFSFQG